MRDIVFLFGAGASYGAGGILPEAPPLGGQLYHALARVYPSSWGALPEPVSAAFAGGDFEGGMSQVYERTGAAIPQLMREMAIYFVQFRPYGRNTLYCRLLSDLKARGLLPRVIFSTLNYECVLEFSILGHGHAINYFDAPDEARLPVWKLHGSCNMFSKDLQATPGILYSTGITFEGGVQAFFDSNRVIEHCLVETALAPVMCLYMRGKPVNVSPGVITHVQRRWSSSIQDAAAVVCIGARPWPADDHIWGPLSRTNAALYFIGDSRDFTAWSSASREGISDVLGSHFNTGYSSLLQRLSFHATQCR